MKVFFISIHFYIIRKAWQYMTMQQDSFKYSNTCAWIIIRHWWWQRKDAQQVDTVVRERERGVAEAEQKQAEAEVLN